MKLLTAHGEKLLLAAVILIAAYTLMSVAGSMQTRTVVSAQTYAALESMNEIFSDTSPMVSWAEPRHADLLMERLGNTGALAQGRFDVGAWVAHPPVLLIDRTTFREGRLGLVQNLAARAEIGRVQLSWNAPETTTVYQDFEGREQSADFVNVAKYEVFRRADGEEYPEKPTFVVQQPGLLDTDVEPEKTYWYKVAAYARPAAPEGDSTVRVRRPQGAHIEDVTLSDGPGWRTISPEEVSANTPSNITFGYRGAYINPASGLNTARMMFRVWTGGDWEEYRAEAVEGGEIVGSRYDPAIRRTVEHPSGHFLVDFGEETREGIMVPLRFVRIRKGERGEPFRVYDDASKRHLGGGQARTPEAPARRELARADRPAGGEGLSLDQLREQVRGTVSTQTEQTGQTATPPSAPPAEIEEPWRGYIVNFVRPPSWRRDDNNLIVSADLRGFLRRDLVAAFTDPEAGSVFAFQGISDPPAGVDAAGLKTFFTERFTELRDVIPAARILQDIKADKTGVGVPYVMASLLYRNGSDLAVSMFCVSREKSILNMVYVYPSGMRDAADVNIDEVLRGFTGAQ